jgi:polysaccharide biosynthesis transport protein
MTFAQFFDALRARWKVVAAVTAVGTSLALGYSLITPKKYVSTAVVVLDAKGVDPIGAYGSTGAVTSSILATQFDILRSDRVARLALERTGLLNAPLLRDMWQKQTGGQGSYPQWASTFIKQSLQVQPSRESNVISIGFEAVDARMATVMANAFAQSYVDVALDLRVSPARRYTQNFDESLNQAKKRLDEARTKLSTFQKDNDLVSSDDRFDVEMARLNELQQQLIMLQSATADSNSRAAQTLNGKSDRLQDVLSNPVVSGIKSSIVAKESELEQLSSQLGDAHPSVAQARAAIQDLKVKLERETRRVADSVVVNSTISRAREADVFAAYEKQRRKVLRLKDTHDLAATLVKDVQSAEQAFDSISARLNQTSLEGQASLPNVSLLSAAEEPSRPTRPVVMLNVMVAFVVSALLGIMVAFFTELRNRRIRSEDDIEEALGDIPLISMGSLHKAEGRGLFLKKKSAPREQEHISMLAAPESAPQALLQQQ